ncbi:hypothetical protein NCAS_0A01380 [Naumovozyma castellii]|uniref:Brl1/Brr6 domain-containing protein n=1 Tax=Naumovozyma castellii TaxID=27288 RepID=G0V9E5_NAUCA|nr:hypothetical protein NCAS_0A01380 [Naumovozyma castellii CBS 4309]CCC86751.1 hypothetical protein NCAS_0A01380 [Naumovozyma castellii CBS 4309]
MDAFSNLSIDDNTSPGGGGATTASIDTLQGISNLSISDPSPNPNQSNNNNNLSRDVIHKFMPHFPNYPSPLRNSMHFLDSGRTTTFDDDVMDLDMNMDEQPPQDDIVVNENQIRRVKFAEPIERTLHSVPEEEEEAQQPDKKQSTSNANANANANANPNMLKALLSPTKLGIAAATKIDGIPVVPESVPPDTNEIEEEIPKANNYTSSSSSLDTEMIKRELRERSKTQPIQVMINNHNYYYPADMSTNLLSPPLASSEYDLPRLSHDTDNRYKLPNPWSINSHPISKVSYSLISYLQLILNCITITAIFSFLTLFVRSIKKDLNSIWETQMNALKIESDLCQKNYFSNKCNATRQLPAMENNCQKWETCMNRNNDIFFRARTTLSAKLCGDIINSFIDPIGWKPLIVILLGLLIWCFSSNFILGFARAKSYYGDPIQRQQLAFRQANNNNNNESQRYESQYKDDKNMGDKSMIRL